MPCSGVTQHHKTDMGPITLPSSRNKVGNDAARGWHPTTQQKFPANKNSTSKVVSLPWHQVFIRMKRKARSFMVFVWIECASLSPISSNILQVIFYRKRQSYARPNPSSVDTQITYHHPAINLRLLPSHNVTERNIVALDKVAPMSSFIRWMCRRGVGWYTDRCTKKKKGVCLSLEYVDRLRYIR